MMSSAASMKMAPSFVSATGALNASMKVSPQAKAPPNR